MRIDGVEISDEQADEFKEAFAEFDMNSDGTIDSKELGLKQKTKGGLLLTLLNFFLMTKINLQLKRLI